MKRAIERHDQGTALVIPIILRPCDWQRSPFSKLRALPKNILPVTKWDDRDSAFLDVAEGIRQAIESLPALPAPSIRRLATLADVEAAIPEALEHGSMFFSDIQRNQLDAPALALLHHCAKLGEGAVC